MFCGQRLKYIALFLLLALIIFGCVKEPDDPVFNNPNDPLSPNYVKTNKPPVEPYQPQPKENETVFSANVRLTWNCYDPDGDPVLYDIYINGSLIVSSVSNQFYEAKEAKLKNGLTYEWFIVAKDNKGNKTDGPKWVFNTDPLIYIADSATVQASEYLSWTMILSKGDKLQVFITSDTDINVWLVSELEFDSLVKNEAFNFFPEGSSERVAPH